ncbi:MAG: HypC/HybG/HupF family hydrogenase formation chaperone [Cyanobacteriota bacterium]|jgi:hydrogenase expression/formation protein HypC
MCLAVQGRILAITDHSPLPPEARTDDDPLWRVAQVDFGGVRQQVSLACLPEAQVGDQVLVHVGLALSIVDELAADERAVDERPADGEEKAYH